ncbi:GNAT family N-acetyltransferase [Patulibacter defluvii]|uniref:GNAT family N-acetyltransferase n=1 Tax=Patulibacter defluvii TaxID=3095358 RepID=UPI002A74E047|nr:GNAT family N-acetyltransferase [Patulibacter sp. DM4]
MSAPATPEGHRPRFADAPVERVTRIDGAIRARLLRIWVDVSNRGGWVGFVPPVDQHDVAPALDQALERVRDGRDWLVVVRDPATAEIVGFAFVADNDRLLSEHWRWVLRVQIHPDHQGRQLGLVLLDGIAEMAREAGIEMLHLTVRGGEGLEDFYARAGYREVARIPRTIRVAPGDDRDQVVLIHEL